MEELKILSELSKRIKEMKQQYEKEIEMFDGERKFERKTYSLGKLSAILDVDILITDKMLRIVEEDL